MRYIYSIIKADYLQRTRSYAFLITLAVTVYAAYLFVPPTGANYTTLSTTGYRGAYNSAWVGYISGIMTTVMLSLYGFLLVNSGIKKDIDTGVGLIVATTSITNFRYLLSKQLSNYLVLLTIASCTFFMSFVMFFIRGTGYPSILSDFVMPYLVFALPALFLIASLAVVAEVFLGKRNILQFIIYFFICGATLAVISSQNAGITVMAFDPFGLSTVTSSIENQINSQFHEDIKQVSFGFIFNGHKTFKVFVWNGVSWNGLFLLSRLIWIGLGLAVVYSSSFFFHRFDFKRPAGKKKKANAGDERRKIINIQPSGITRASMPPVVIDYGILPFIKTELLLLIRKGNKWLWIINIGLSLSMLFTPLNIAHTYLLPILWFLQVTRWSELATGEKTYRLHYFTYASYKPLHRMLPAQVLAGVILAVSFALPLLFRYAIVSDGYSIINILNGSVFIVLLGVCLGIVSGGKKLYEVLFFLLTYAVLNKVPAADYLGSLPHENRMAYLFILLLLNVFLAATSLFVRNHQMRHL